MVNMSFNFDFCLINLLPVHVTFKSQMPVDIRTYSCSKRGYSFGKFSCSIPSFMTMRTYRSPSLPIKENRLVTSVVYTCRSVIHYSFSSKGASSIGTQRPLTRPSTFRLTSFIALSTFSSTVS